MYTPASFAMTPDEIRAHLESARVGDYVTSVDGELQATYLPVVFDPEAGEQGAFHLHLMRVNPQWKRCDKEALLILHGNTHLIMASYYGDDRSVGTLNYETLHVYGTPIVHDDLDYLRDVVAKVAELNERSWRLEDMDPAARDKMLRAAVGVELQITRVEGKAKLSQNKHPDVIETLANHLDDDGDATAAALLRTRSLPQARARQDLVDGIRSRHLRGRDA